MEELQTVNERSIDTRPFPILMNANQLREAMNKLEEIKRAALELGFDYVELIDIVGD